ncbi:MAG: hypothetical protein ACTH3N_07150 [Corynebacterium casei]|uniref:Uncharacterized protein n=1 Tax=Corynebacterium casei UCMA 3821 TaxID=1110505 RepID=G7HYN5_9CORY|nr:hypothetical protein [Corynebacterium casei]CCE55300.1 putative uncharacterized protein [Corynebacterium casei UCMA 3821]
MQDNIEQDLSEYLQSLNAQRENQADAQREADINSLSNLFIKKAGTINV